MAKKEQKTTAGEENNFKKLFLRMAVLNCKFMADDQKENQEEQDIVYDEADEAGEVDDGQLPDRLKKLKEKLKKCGEEKAEYLTGWQREKADFINFRRRQEEQIAEWTRMSQAGLINDLLPVLDSLNQSVAAKVDGIEIIKQQLWDVFKKHGLEEIKSINEKFNPELHEAIGTVESGEEEGIVIEEAQKGYLLNGKVLRTSKVKVTKKM